MREILKESYLILGSGSPRRKQLLTDAGYEFRVETRPTDEHIPGHINAENAALFLAEQKAYAFKTHLRENAVLITADTTVILDNQILGKASNETHAAQMLMMLSGRQHIVKTGICICANGIYHSFDDTTIVWFKKLTRQQIDFYIRNYAPYDKAGAYGVQDWLGMIGIEKLEGCYYNVMGLPVQKLFAQLQSFVSFDFQTLNIKKLV